MTGFVLKRILRGLNTAMCKNELNAEQWQAIAEMLANYIDVMCGSIDDCDLCPFKEHESCDHMFALDYVKKELGYE